MTKKGAKDIGGVRFGRLLAVVCVGKDKWNNNLWKCKCDCGNEIVVRRNNLSGERTKSCGCLAKENAITHGASKTRLYKIWYGIIRRTEDPNRKEYSNYGGRGISMFTEWRESFEVFKDWALMSGYEDTLSIERINNDGDYEPANCRWATSDEQANNRTDTCYLTLKGITKSVVDWAKDTGIPYATLKKRMRLGWSDERVLSL